METFTSEVFIMTAKTAEIAEMIDLLPDNDKDLAYELIRKLVLAWDPDFTKLTASERARLEEAESDPGTVSHSSINWD